MIRQKLQIHNLQTARSYIERNANYSLNVGSNFMLIFPLFILELKQSLKIGISISCLVD